MLTSCTLMFNERRLTFKLSFCLFFMCFVCVYRNNTITADIITNTFSVEYLSFGVMKELELKPGGKSIPVTDENKREYVKYVPPARQQSCLLRWCLICLCCYRLYVNWRYMRGVEAQFLALQKGFNELIPQHMLRPFDEKELEVMNALAHNVSLSFKSKTKLIYTHCVCSLSSVVWGRSTYPTGAHTLA